LIVGVWGIAVMEAAPAETIVCTKSGEAFGGTLFGVQITRFVLAECATLSRIARAFVDDCIVQFRQGRLDNAAASTLM
jgi:acyl-CoA dehydrogenase